MMLKTHPAKGFTLIELMIVVAIISLLAAIAYPGYTDYVMKSKRSIATSALTQIAARQEQYRMDNKEYAADLTNLGYPSNPVVFDDASNPVAAGSDGQTYSISVNRPNTQEYTLTAAPLGAQDRRDTDCASFTLTHEGTKGVTGTESVRNCW